MDSVRRQRNIPLLPSLLRLSRGWDTSALCHTVHVGRQTIPAPGYRRLRHCSVGVWSLASYLVSTSVLRSYLVIRARPNILLGTL